MVPSGIINGSLVHGSLAMRSRRLTSGRRSTPAVGGLIVTCCAIALYDAPATHIAAVVPPARGVPSGFRRHWLQIGAASAWAPSLPAWSADYNGYMPDPVAKLKVNKATGAEVLEIARPRGQKKKLYSFILPIPAGNSTDGKRAYWGDYTKDDLKAVDVVFKGAFGKSRKDDRTCVIAGNLPKNFVADLRNSSSKGDGNFTMIRDESSADKLDLEWTTISTKMKKTFKVYSFARVLYSPEKVPPGSKQTIKDVIVFLQIPEDQLERVKPLWPAMRDSFAYGSMLEDLQQVAPIS
eukprot:TRINITY_DN35436_c0_g1_i1.p1 TRINITY_DN35436_c0_g1~~TRINITY_DN35436_c0_g1_i1.p1  ORF type:complete len:294 (-),score=33.53 TRINITY_DN35436_c0_g1_i1:55-936(-)